MKEKRNEDNWARKDEKTKEMNKKKWPKNININAQWINAEKQATERNV